MYVNVRIHAGKACGGADLPLRSLVMSALDGVEWSATGPGSLLLRKETLLAFE